MEMLQKTIGEDFNNKEELRVAVQNVCQESLKEILKNGYPFAEQNLQSNQLGCSYVFTGTKPTTGAPKKRDQSIEEARKTKDYIRINQRCVLSKTKHLFWDKLIILYYESRVKGTSADNSYFVQCMQALEKAHRKKGGSCVRPDQIRCNKDKSVLNKKNYPFLVEKYIEHRAILLSKLFAATSNWKTVDQFIDEVIKIFGKECSLYVRDKMKRETGILEILENRKQIMEGYKLHDDKANIYEEP